MDLKDLLHAAEVILDKAPDRYVYAATLSRKNDRPVDKLEALLLNVGEALCETLYANTHSVVFASATLTVDESFSAFESSLGLNTDEQSRCRACQLDSSYDYDGAHDRVRGERHSRTERRRLLCPRSQKLLVDVHRAQRGSMLTLFTNRREMENCFEAVQPALKSDDLRLVCQKWGVSVKGLRDDFLADEHLSLVRAQELLGRVRCAGRHAQRGRHSQAALLQADRPAVLRARDARRPGLASVRAARSRSGDEASRRPAHPQGRRLGCAHPDRPSASSRRGTARRSSTRCPAAPSRSARRQTSWPNLPRGFRRARARTPWASTTKKRSMRRISSVTP